PGIEVYGRMSGIVASGRGEGDLIKLGAVYGWIGHLHQCLHGEGAVFGERGRIDWAFVDGLDLGRREIRQDIVEGLILPKGEDPQRESFQAPVDLEKLVRIIGDVFDDRVRDEGIRYRNGPLVAQDSGIEVRSVIRM